MQYTAENKLHSSSSGTGKNPFENMSQRSQEIAYLLGEEWKELGNYSV